MDNQVLSVSLERIGWIIESYPLDL